MHPMAPITAIPTTCFIVAAPWYEELFTDRRGTNHPNFLATDATDPIALEPSLRWQKRERGPTTASPWRGRDRPPAGTRDPSGLQPARPTTGWGYPGESG